MSASFLALSKAKTYAKLTYDCARKLRVAYALAKNVSEAFATGLPAESIRIDRFSRHIQGAHDHFSVEMPGNILVKGVLGRPLLEVIFWKDDQNTLQKQIQAIHTLLHENGFGKIVPSGPLQKYLT